MDALRLCELWANRDALSTGGLMLPHPQEAPPVPDSGAWLSPPPGTVATATSAWEQ